MRYLAMRGVVAVVTFLVGVSSVGLLERVWPGAENLSADARAVLAVEREYIRAHTEGDVEALERVLADDFTSFGGRVRKEHRLALLANPLFKFTAVETEGVRVETHGRTARVTGSARTSGIFRGREFTTPRYEFTRRYEKRDGRWLIVSCEFSYGWGKRVSSER